MVYGYIQYMWFMVYYMVDMVYGYMRYMWCTVNVECGGDDHHVVLRGVGLSWPKGHGGHVSRLDQSPSGAGSIRSSLKVERP